MVVVFHAVVVVDAVVSMSLLTLALLTQSTLGRVIPLKTIVCSGTLGHPRLVVYTVLLRWQSGISDTLFGLCQREYVRFCFIRSLVKDSKEKIIIFMELGP